MADPAASGVTVAIPCSNAARWIARAVESALGQEGVRTEVIVVDDASADGSAEILREFGDRIRVLASDRRGANRARNLALAAARTEWVQFLDADDYLLPGKIAAQLAAAESDPSADAVYGPVLIEEMAAGTREVAGIDEGLDLFGQWISWQMPQTGGVLWRRAALEHLGGWNESMPCCQEHELYLRALKAGTRFLFSPEPGAVYRIWSEETLCRRDPAQTIRVRTELIEDLRGWMLARGLWSESHRELAGRAYFEMARTLWKSDPAAAAAYHERMRAEGLIRAAGPAAPFRYRAIYRLFGFVAAEKIARRFRR